MNTKRAIKTSKHQKTTYLETSKDYIHNIKKFPAWQHQKFTYMATSKVYLHGNIKSLPTWQHQNFTYMKISKVYLHGNMPSKVYLWSAARTGSHEAK